MVALGHFRGDEEQPYTVGAANKEYSFRPCGALRAALFELPHFWFTAWLNLNVTHDPNGGGTLRSLELGLDMHCEDAIRSHNPDGWVDECHTRQFRHVLSYLAGVPHLARGRVLNIIEGFYEPE